jgi:hypothetical protein
MKAKTRIAKLEKAVKPQQPTWKDFITGVWQPSPDKWAEFLKASDTYEHKKPTE